MITVDVGRNVHLSIDETTPLMASTQGSMTSSTKNLNLKNPPGISGVRASSIIVAAKRELRELNAQTSSLPSV